MNDVQEAASSHAEPSVVTAPTPEALALQAHVGTPTRDHQLQSVHSRLLELTKEDKLDVGKLSEFVALLHTPGLTLEEEFELVTPLLLCDAKTLSILAAEHHALEALQRWISTAFARPRLLRILLKVVDKMIKKVPLCLFQLKDSQMIDTLKELRSYSDPESAAHAHEMIQHIKLLVADSNEPQLSSLLEALHEKNKRHLEISSEDELEETFAKRPMTAAFAIDDSTMISIPLLPSSQSTVDSESLEESGSSDQFQLSTDASYASSSTSTSPMAVIPKGISTKTGKPKKSVRWVADDEHQETFFHKHLPIRHSGLNEDGWDDDGKRYQYAEEIPWKMKKVDFGSEIPPLVKAAHFIHSDHNSTRAQSQETDRQRLEYIALYLSDSDIPQNPSDAPADQTNVLTPETSLLHIPFTRRNPSNANSSTPVLTRLQLPNAAPTNSSNLSNGPNGAKHHVNNGLGSPHTLGSLSMNIPHNNYNQIQHQGPLSNIPPYNPATGTRNPGGFYQPGFSPHNSAVSSPSQYSAPSYSNGHNSAPSASNMSTHNPMAPQNVSGAPPLALPQGALQQYPPQNNLPSVSHEQALQLLAALQQQARDTIPGYAQSSAPAPQPPYVPPLHNGYPPLQHNSGPYQPQYPPPQPQYPQHHAASSGPDHRTYSSSYQYPHQPPGHRAGSAPYSNQRPMGAVTSSPWVNPNEIYPTAFDFGRLKSREDRAKLVCRHWKMQSGCDYGAKCNFLHPKDTDSFVRQ